MRIATDRAMLRVLCDPLRQTHGRIGFVPTMGAFHAGHLRLMEQARETCDKVVVSIFVNPTQFGPSEDYQNYPRDLPGDTEKCRKMGVDLLFLPTVEEVYPAGFETQVLVKRLSEKLCGLSRPGHFQGVATIVLKLLNLIRPQAIFLGKKDYQQCVILKRMTRDLDLDLDLDVVICPIVREPDGLAMSSRNAYLTSGERQAAPTLYRSLQETARVFLTGESDAARLHQVVVSALGSEPLVAVDYVHLVHPETLEDVKEVAAGTVLAIAAQIGRTRLIDNWTFGDPTPSEKLDDRTLGKDVSR